MLTLCETALLAVVNVLQDSNLLTVTPTHNLEICGNTTLPHTIIMPPKPRPIRKASTSTVSKDGLKEVSIGSATAASKAMLPPPDPPRILEPEINALGGCLKVHSSPDSFIGTHSETPSRMQP